MTAPTRHEARRAIADRLLRSLDDLVRRHRALALTTEHVDLHAELIAAEVAHELAKARGALHRHPPLA
jgi:tRNA G46 methylase TrmB